jgi:iron-sulfur cluster assembly protein
MAQAETTLITMTEAARNQVRQLLEAESQDGLGLRLSVKGGGCSGLSYEVSFTRSEPGDHIVEYPEGFQAFVDPKSLLYLKGIEVDFQGGVSGRGFAFRNPNAENTCGCGESFSV